MNDTLKERIGQYELLEIIGDGAQGKVFKARCADAAGGPVAGGEVVALKVLRVPPDDDQARQRFEAQAALLKRLANPYLIRYRDSFVWHPGEWDEAQCLVMEYLEGETLASRLLGARRGLPWPEVKTIFEQCLDGLVYAGKEGIIHRDLKPSNIFLARDGSVRIFDFDIARIEGASQRSTVGWKGSFDYMAPDFITEPDFHGDEVSDVFSLGVCICQALTGKLPFEPLGENAHIGYLNRWRSGAAAPALSFRAGAYRVLANSKAFIGRSLSPQRAARYGSFAEMLADFQRIRRRVVQHQGKDSYELRELLGRGGFGEVFGGVRLSDGLPVAIKHLFAERQSARFVKEAKLLQRYVNPQKSVN
jgi:serine/threonine protein kinase